MKNQPGSMQSAGGATTDGPRFEFIGGNAIVDFHNTAAWPGGRVSNERLRRPIDLVKWSEEAGMITGYEGRKLRALALRRPKESRRALADAIKFRGLLHSILGGLTDEARLDPRLLSELTHSLRRTRASLAVEWRDGRLEWSHGEATAISALVNRIVWHAGELLVSADMVRLGRCANPSCGWIFIDRTKNGIRRWCSMSDCGGRAKARAYYLRKKRGNRARE